MFYTIQIVIKRPKVVYATCNFYNNLVYVDYDNEIMNRHKHF